MSKSFCQPFMGIIECLIVKVVTKFFYDEIK